MIYFSVTLLTGKIVAVCCKEQATGVGEPRVKARFEFENALRSQQMNRIFSQSKFRTDNPLCEFLADGFV